MSLVTFTNGTVLDAQDLNDSFAAVNVIKAIASNMVAATQSTTSTSYTNLATTGPTVTLTTGTLAIVIMSATFGEPLNDATAMRMTFEISGATTLAAADNESMISPAANISGDPSITISRTQLVTVTAGSNTFTAKYRVGSGTGSYGGRNITVIAI